MGEVVYSYICYSNQAGNTLNEYLASDINLKKKGPVGNRAFFSKGQFVNMTGKGTCRKHNKHSRQPTEKHKTNT